AVVRPAGGGARRGLGRDGAGRRAARDHRPAPRAGAAQRGGIGPAVGPVDRRPARARLARGARHGRRCRRRLPRARAVARSGRASGRPRGDPRAAARIRGRGARAPLPVARATRVRAARVGDVRPAQPRGRGGAHQAARDPRQGRRHPGHGTHRRPPHGRRRVPPQRDRGDPAGDAGAAVTMARSVLIPPRQHCWVESDSFDRSTFAGLLGDTPSLTALLERGGALVPHFRELVEDLFCVLYKLEPRWRDPGEVAPAAAFNRELLAGLRDHPLLDSVRAESQLDAVKAGLGALLLGEHVLTLLREERLLPRGDLLDLWDLDRRERDLRRAGEELADLEGSEAAEGTREQAEQAARAAEGELRQRAGRGAERLTRTPPGAGAAVPAALGGLRRELADAADEAQSWGTGLGTGGRHARGRQTELGRRLATNPKLRRLAALVGRMRSQAMALRRTSLERSSEEMFDVELGRT